MTREEEGEDLSRGRILVLTAIERAFYSSVVEYQLLEPLAEVADRCKPLKFSYLGLVPLTFYFNRWEPIRSLFLYRDYRSRIKGYLGRKGVACFFVPMLFPLRHKEFFLKGLSLALFLMGALPVFLLFVLMLRIRVVHARSYPAALLAFLGRKLLGVRYVFDMRDLYPEKGVEAGAFRERSFSFRLWKRLERRLLKDAHAVITTSKPFARYVEGIFPHVRILICPNCVDPERFHPDEEKRSALRRRYGLEGKFALLHSGAFGTLPDCSLIARYFLHWKRVTEDAHLIMLCGTKRYLRWIEGVLRETGVSEEDYTLINPEPMEVPELLLLGDVGLHLESKAIATPYCIAVKDGEYLATGMPIVCTPHLKGIAPLVEEYGCGIVVDPDGESSDDKELRFVRGRERARANGFRLVQEHLARKHCVRRLVGLYQEFGTTEESGTTD